mgnify:CR=1 FL=1
MSTTIKGNLDASAGLQPLSLEAFEAWEEKYKKDLPEMYKARVENGDIERQRALCGGKPKAEAKEEPKAEEKKVAKSK